MTKVIKKESPVRVPNPKPIEAPMPQPAEPIRQPIPVAV